MCYAAHSMHAQSFETQNLVGELSRDRVFLKVSLQHLVDAPKDEVCWFEATSTKIYGSQSVRNKDRLSQQGRASGCYDVRFDVFNTAPSLCPLVSRTAFHQARRAGLRTGRCVNRLTVPIGEATC